jgi:hypothetical protein
MTGATREAWPPPKPEARKRRDKRSAPAHAPWPVFLDRLAGEFGGQGADIFGVKIRTKGSCPRMGRPSAGCRQMQVAAFAARAHAVGAVLLNRRLFTVAPRIAQPIRKAREALRSLRGKR